jgi:hypothetical protein
MLEFVLKRSLQIRQFTSNPNVGITTKTLLPPALRSIGVVVRSLVKAEVSIHVQLPPPSWLFNLEVSAVFLKFGVQQVEVRTLQ